MTADGVAANLEGPRVMEAATSLVVLTEGPVAGPGPVIRVRSQPVMEAAIHRDRSLGSLVVEGDPEAKVPQTDATPADGARAVVKRTVARRASANGAIDPRGLTPPRKKMHQWKK
jgi:hypothetical protein